MSTKKNISNINLSKTESTITNTVSEVNSTIGNMDSKSNAVSKSGVTYMFNKKNYMFMIAGLVLIAIGFILMSGGKSADPNVFNAKELYSFRRITLAPILVMAGFIVEIFAIMRVPKAGEE